MKIGFFQSYFSNTSGLINIGEYSPDSLILSASHNDYFTLIDSLLIINDTTINIYLTPNRASVTFHVMDVNGNLSGAKVIMSASQYTNTSGNAFFFLQPARENYSYTVEKSGYEPVEASFYLELDTTLDVKLENPNVIPTVDPWDLIIRPNPIDLFMNISIKENSLLCIYDLSGRLRLNMSLVEGSNIIPTDHLEQGGYILKIICRERIYKKLIFKL